MPPAAVAQKGRADGKRARRTLRLVSAAARFGRRARTSLAPHWNVVSGEPDFCAIIHKPASWPILTNFVNDRDGHKFVRN